MFGLLRSAIALSVLLLWSVNVVAQCADGQEVCLQPHSSAALPIAETIDSTTDQSTGDQSSDLATDGSSVTLTDEITTETFTDEQAELVEGITLDLKRRSLTRPIGNNASEKILRLKEIHPKHDYSVNGNKYIARILRQR